METWNTLDRSFKSEHLPDVQESSYIVCGENRTPVGEQTYIAYGEQESTSSHLSVNKQIADLQVEADRIEKIIDTCAAKDIRFSANLLLETLAARCSNINLDDICNIISNLSENCDISLEASDFLKIKDLSYWQKSFDDSIRSNIFKDTRNESNMLNNSQQNFRNIFDTKKDSETTESSLGILNTSEMSSFSCESYEGVGGETSFKDLAELTNEVDELQYQNKKLIEENSRLQSQMSTTDEVLQQISTENEKLKSRISALKSTVDKVKELQCSNEELKSSLQSAEGTCMVLKQNLEEARKKIEELETCVKDLEEKLHVSHIEIETNKQHELNLLQTVCDQKHILDKLYHKSDDLESQLLDKSLKCQEMELAVKELTEVNASLRIDASALELELSRAKEEVTRILNDEKIVPSIEREAPECDEPFSSNQVPVSATSSMNFYKIRYSTPIVRSRIIQEQSLNMEMADVMSPNSDLPIPFCGKYDFPNSSGLSFESPPPKKCRQIPTTEGQVQETPPSKINFQASDIEIDKKEMYFQRLLSGLLRCSGSESDPAGLAIAERFSNENIKTSESFTEKYGQYSPVTSNKFSSNVSDAVKKERHQRKLYESRRHKRSKTDPTDLVSKQISSHFYVAKPRRNRSEKYSEHEASKRYENISSDFVKALLSFLVSIRDDLKAQRKYIESTNIDAKEGLKVELDIPQLESHYLGAGEGSIKCASLTRTHAGLSMPEHIWSQGDVIPAESKLVSDLSATDIREQINAEIKALRTQLVRSHALLNYLQLREKPHLKSHSEDSHKLHGESLDDQLLRGGLLEQSFDIQAHHYRSSRTNSSNTSHRSSPLYKSNQTRSCPVLCVQSQTVSKCTQTETVHKISWRNDDEIENISSKSTEVFNYPEPDYSKSFGLSHVPYTASISDRTSKNIEHGVCEVHCFPTESESPLLPRHRTNSFLAAVIAGNSVSANLINNSSRDSMNCYSVADRSKIEEINHPYFGLPAASFKQFAQTTSGNKDCFQTVDSNNETKRDSDANSFVGSQQTSQNHIENATEDVPSSDVSDEKQKTDREKSFKISQRSMRRSSATGSPNSLTAIPRCPAFDFSEQEDEQTLSITTSEPEANQGIKLTINENNEEIDTNSVKKSYEISLKDTSQRKRETSKSKNLMPELTENSETESAKGSFEYETPEVSYSSEPPPLPVPDTPFPNLPNSLLLKLGINKESSIPVESFSEQELENKFMTLSLAFKTDKMTLSKRLEIQNRQRDIAEKNVENEIKTLKESLNVLNLNATSTETRDLIAKIQNHVDIVQQATSRISARSETYGAVQQEERVSRAFEVLILHVDHLKRLFDKEHRELEETRRMLTDTHTPQRELGRGDGIMDDRKRSFKTLGIAVGSIKSVSRRRASVADFNQHLSLERCRTPPPLNRSWTSGFMVETKSRLINALSPFTVASSIDQNRNSLSCPSTPLARTFSGSNISVNNSRRCSLPASSVKCSPLRSVSRLSELNEEVSTKHRLNDQKISVAPSLYSVTDEKEQSDNESDREQQTDADKSNECTPQNSLDTCSDCEQTEEKIQNDEANKNIEEEISEISDSESVNSNGSEVSNKEGTSITLLERYFSPEILHVWRNSSHTTILRYVMSGFLFCTAILTLLLTFLPCDASSDFRHFEQVLDALIHHFFDVRHINKPV